MDTFEASVRVEMPEIKKVAKQKVAKHFEEKAEEDASNIPPFSTPFRHSCFNSIYHFICTYMVCMLYIVYVLYMFACYTCLHSIHCIHVIHSEYGMHICMA